VVVRSMQRFAAAAVIAGSVVLVAASPAHAIPGLTSVSAISAIDSSTTKTATATCPSGTTVVGGGGYAYALGGQPFITGVRPIVSIFGTGYQVVATEGEAGFAGNWYAFSYALCVPAPAGLTYQWTVSPTSSLSARTVTTTCPAGTNVLSTGAVIDGGGQDVALRAVLPSVDLTRLTAQAHEDETGYGGSWSLTSWAVCADVPGLERVVAYPTTYPTSATAVCPAPKRVHGAGGTINGSAAEVRLVGVYPSPAVNGAYAVGAEDASGYAGTWYPTGVAICAN
jgi:hypothetical protein